MYQIIRKVQVKLDRGLEGALSHPLVGRQTRENSDTMRLPKHDKIPTSIQSSVIYMYIHILCMNSMHTFQIPRRIATGTSVVSITIQTSSTIWGAFLAGSRKCITIVSRSTFWYTDPRNICELSFRAQRFWNIKRRLKGFISVFGVSRGHLHETDAGSARIKAKVTN